MNKRKEPKLYFILSCLLVTIIYSTLSLVRPICNFFKRELPFNLVVSVALVGLFVLIVLAVVVKNKIKKKSTLLFLISIFLVYIISFKWIDYPEEKIHLFEYGFLAFLLYKSFSFNNKEKFLPYLFSFVISSLIGLGDELIQGVLPTRYYQTSDVILNSVSAGLGLLFVYIFKRDKN